jgi:methyl-accepting chemotaxis protein
MQSTNLRSRLLDLESAKATHRQTGEVAGANQAVAAVLGDLTAAIGRVSAVITDNMDKSEVAAMSIRDALETIESVAAISEENAASAERVASSTGMVSEQAQEVHDAAAALTGIARELQGSTARFRLERAESDAAGAIREQKAEETVGPRKKAA